MLIGVAVVWYALPGCEHEVEALLLEMRELTVREPGCRYYWVHRLAFAGQFLLYEQYDDLAAVRAHHATEHYRRLVRGRAPGLVRERRIVRGELIA
ncbi:putative quinol monooxygenase [Conexibacter sp. CPCC 206217]|uniref:putative quinol monooxygenase n=1 Tax=Conexibacter sp. CPCC 206217 TaxID=3064574 RepID=UPI0027203A69|nr:putative quinol monooxygenase [Conexibacter sp. CPCC 206217]MDO8211710.1 putative quinol monooxygenase [Conexibacter sp. CPCC 206217]